MPLGNIVILDTGKPERMHFSDHIIEKRDITDPLTGRPAIRNVLVFDVDELNGMPVAAKFSTMAEKLYSTLEPYLVNKAYLNYDMVITRMGTGFRTTYVVNPLPRSK